MTSRVRTPPSKVLTFSWRVVFFLWVRLTVPGAEQARSLAPLSMAAVESQKSFNTKSSEVWGVSPKMRGCVFTNKLGASLTLETQPPSYCKIQQLLWEWNNCSKIGKKKSGTIFPSYKPLKLGLFWNSVSLFLFVFLAAWGLKELNTWRPQTTFQASEWTYLPPRMLPWTCVESEKSEGFSVELKDQCCTMLPFFHWFEKG